MFAERLALPAPERQREIGVIIERVHAAIEQMQRMPQPILASVHGAVAGFGLSLMGACDLALAADTAYFTSAYRHIGVTPDGSSTWTLPRLVGAQESDGDRPARRPLRCAGGAATGAGQPRRARGDACRSNRDARPDIWRTARRWRSPTASDSSISRCRNRFPYNLRRRRRASPRALRVPTSRKAFGRFSTSGRHALASPDTTAAPGPIIRAAIDADFTGIWAIFQQVIAAGDTYAYAADTTRREARRIWTEAPAEAFVAEEAGGIVGTYTLRPAQPGLGNHIANCGYMTHASGAWPRRRRRAVRHSLTTARSAAIGRCSSISSSPATTGPSVCGRSMVFAFSVVFRARSAIASSA